MSSADDKHPDDDRADAPAENVDDILADFVREAEDAYDDDVGEPTADESAGDSADEIVTQADVSADDSAVLDLSDDDLVEEEPGEPIDAELAAEVAQGLQQNLIGVGSTPAGARAESTSAPKYKLVRTVDIEIDPPVTQPLTLGLGEHDSLYVLDRPSTDRFRIIRVPFVGGRGETVLELEDGSADNGLLDPVGIAVDGEGRMYVPDAEGNFVKVFSPDGRWLETLETAGELGAAFDHPRDVDVADDGHLYIADTYNNRVVKMTGEGELVWEFERFTHPVTGDAEDELYEPGSVCVAGDRVAVADTNQNRIVTIGTDGHVQSVLESGGLFEYPTEVRITEDGVIYVADFSNLHVQRFAPDGTRNGLIDLRDEEAEMSGGGDIDIDPDGNVVMIDPVREAVVVLGFVEPE